ncbi:MAG: hypothetical protein HUJ68_07615 [Clostridia bacterium]|nr:hypothetical protein [Clostridia bacterium]
MIKVDDWIIYKRADYYKVKDFVDYDKVVCLISNNDVYEAYYTGSAKQNQMKVLRIVIAPYREKGGEPKGWFPGNDGTPLRWTGLGNVIRAVGEHAEEMIADTLKALTSPIDFEIKNCGDYVFIKLDENTVGVAAKKLYELSK